MTKEPRIDSVERTVSSIKKNVGETGWPDAKKKKKNVKVAHYHTHKMTEWVKDSAGSRGLSKDRCMNISEELLTLRPAGGVTVSWCPRDWTGVNVNLIPGQSSREGSAPNKARCAGRLCRTFYTTVKTVDFILTETEVLEIVTEDQVEHSGWSIEDEQGGMALKGQL